MKDLKTTAIGALQLFGAAGFVAFKVMNATTITDAEAGLVMLALTSGLKGLVSADAKPDDGKPEAPK